MNDDPVQLKRELRRLFRSMDFVSRHSALNKRGAAGERFAEIYQQLGMLWELLALQCRHTEGWRKTREGKSACKVCGAIRGIQERWLLLPRTGRKVVGRMTMPNSKETFAHKKTATVVSDAIEFHGGKLSVDVHNAYRSQLFRRRGITVAADRVVQLKDGGVECWLDTRLVRLRLNVRKPKAGLPYSAFVWELPRKALKRFPVILEFDRRGELTGVTIFKPDLQKQ